jgi:hypothetical protein
MSSLPPARLSPPPSQAIFLCTLIELLKEQGVDAAAEHLTSKAANMPALKSFLQQHLPRTADTLAQLRGAATAGCLLWELLLLSIMTCPGLVPGRSHPQPGGATGLCMRRSAACSCVHAPAGGHHPI